MKSEIELAVEKKNKSIRTFQNAKEEGMKLFASRRDATMMMTAYADRYKNLSDEELKEKMVEWANWLYVAFYDTDPNQLLREQFKDDVPF